MDFYKKISKPKDISAILNEKEYKCVSLNAITNEAVKENNKERLKVLVEEINEHLQDLRQLNKEHKEPKIKERCENLIKQYEECLFRILHPKPLNNFLPVLNEKYDEVHKLSNIAIQKSNEEYLKKMAEKIKSHIEVLKEMPEIKSSKSSENREEYLQLLSKNEELLHKINNCLNSKKISDPIPVVEVPQKMLQGNTQEPENPPPIPKKIGLNEVEEKLKLMRQKRLSRLSTFVDQRSKLSEQRSRENSPKNSNNFNHSPENLGTVSESEEIESAIKSIQSSEVGKSSTLLRSIARENIANSKTGQKVFLETEKDTELKLQSASFGEQTNEVAASFKNVAKRVAVSKLEIHSGGTKGASGSSYVNQVKNPVGTDIKSLREEYKADIKVSKEEKRENENITFSKGTLTRSFAERQIENARMKEALSDKPKVSTNLSNSLKKTPPRTPTQFKKIFNTFNACVVGTSNVKSIEDLPAELTKSLEQESKTAYLKSTSFENRLETYKNSNTDLKYTSVKDSHEQQFQVSDGPSSVLKNTKTVHHLKSEPDILKTLGDRAVSADKSPSQVQGYAEKVTIDKNPKTECVVKAKRRLSLDFDSIITPESKPLYLSQQPSDLLITVKKDGNPPPDSKRCSFSTFRSSTDSIKSIEQNSLQYDFAKNDNGTKTMGNLNEYKIIDNEKYSSCEKAFKSLSFNCGYLENLLKNVPRKNLVNINFTDKIKELNLLLKDVRNEIENCLDIEIIKGNENFAKIIKEIENIEKTITTFRGLKRDEEYLMLDKQLAKYYSDIHQFRPQSSDERNRKIDLTERLQEAYKNLENKVKKNEEILKNILDEQVKMLGQKYTLA